MRIVIWTDSFSPNIGGLEIFCLRLMQAWRSRGHDCLIIANCDPASAPRQERMHDVEVHRYSFHHALNHADLAAFRQMTEACGRIILDFAPDLIHLNGSSKGLLPFAVLQRRLRLPGVATLHDRHLYRNANALTGEVLDFTNAVVGVSEFIATDARAHLPALSAKLRVIPNALPAPELQPSPFPERWRFLAMGRLIREKGFDLALEAFARVADAFPEATLTIAGDGIARPELEALARTLGVAARVEFLGRTAPSDIPRIVNQHSAVIVPSRWEEPFGLVALEAAQMGRPVCAARCGGLPEIVVDGQTGILFRTGDADDLAHALRRLLQSADLAEKMGRCARARVAQHFVYATFLDRYEALYREVAQLAPSLSGDFVEAKSCSRRLGHCSVPPHAY